MKKKKVLVIDDEPDIVEFLRDLLEDNGYAVVSATNSHDALDLIKQNKPDIILLDMLMPEETGTGFYRKLLEIKECKDIPIIIVSAIPKRNLPLDKSIPVIDKPIEEKKMLAELRNILYK
ncbi:MAG: hypothetical protein A2161_12310 [Candidatus Schekmanbacteria bacterium RBG_13_48_7]|uniref:Response regulatory domain-containing protein n=1 Tax=Candidatus Schekmanbacteria bacterium RBG_13_48_7 TaxID=1817878 RepID=A0A1F7RSY5_9BACT|nr:MAG: hypothetical protein A2161_12310 [Candidatus Schekmanbacteria bacterium RBG_13_48_7]